MSRRGQHEGSIYKREDGRWAATLSLGYEHGKRRRKTYYGQTRKAVQEQLTAALRVQQQGLPISTNDRQTVAQYFVHWLETIKPTTRFNTWARYEQYIRLYLAPSLGGIALSKLTPQHVQALYSAKLTEGYAVTTIAHLHSVVHHGLDVALRLGLVQRNVSELVDAPPIQRAQTAPLSLAQVRALLSAAASDRLEALYVVAITTGMRQGELFALKWQDVDETSPSVYVRATLQSTHAGLVFYQPKTPRSRRKITLTSFAVKALRRHRARQLEERLARGPSWQEMDLVFTNMEGGALRKSNVLHDSFKPLLKRAGLPAIRFHDLRHTAATLMLLQGIHPKVVSEMLGHASISITLDLYSHVLPNMQKDAVGRMDTLLADTM